MRLGRRAVVRVAVASVLALLLTSGLLWLSRNPGQGLHVPADDSGGTAPDLGQPWPSPAVGDQANPSGPPFVTSIAPGGRYFLDQDGRPILVHGDSPWAMMTRFSPQDAELWFADRRDHGVNAAIVSLIGATANGAPHDDGTTVDGLKPFVGGDILHWREPYWQRVTSYLKMAQANGITVMLYPIDGWTIGHSFVPKSAAQCQRYGTRLAQRFAAFPNIVWVSGGDYFPSKATDDLAAGSEVDHCIAAAIRGLRGGGDPHLFSMQLGYDKSVSTENPYWADKVDWNFVYTYHPTYTAVLEAYAHHPIIPTVLGEANYEGENNQPETPMTTEETLRRQMLWALTSGAAGEFTGSQDWSFRRAGWQKRLDTPAQAQLQRLRAVFAGLDWWRLVPDRDGGLVIGGRGTRLVRDARLDVLQNDYVTAARSKDGKLALIYVPTRRTITVDRDRLAPGVRAEWIDPASGARTPVPMAGPFTTPGKNSGGDGDWLLLLHS